MDKLEKRVAELEIRVYKLWESARYVPKLYDNVGKLIGKIPKLGWERVFTISRLRDHDAKLKVAESRLDIKAIAYSND